MRPDPASLSFRRTVHEPSQSPSSPPALLASGVAATAQTLSIGFADPVSSVDPQLNNHAGDRSLALHFWDSIINSRDGGKLEPALAIELEGARRASTWEFKLRSDVKWQDGTPFTADDIVFSFQRARSVPGTVASYTGACARSSRRPRRTRRPDRQDQHAEPDAAAGHRVDLHRQQACRRQGQDRGLQRRPRRDRHRAVQVHLVQPRRPHGVRTQPRRTTGRSRCGTRSTTASSTTARHARRRCWPATST